MQAKTLGPQVKDRQYWLRLARNCVVQADMVETVADYMVANPTSSLWHAAWDLHGQKGKCSCTPCTLARGEKLSCL